jgi:phosphatidylinositol-3-phosphatase
MKWSTVLRALGVLFTVVLSVASLFLVGHVRSSRAATAVGTYPGSIKHVFVIAMENHDWSEIKGSSSAPYINSLLTRSDASYASNYHNVTSTETPTGDLPSSESDYVWMEAGTNTFSDYTFTNNDDASGSNSTASTAHVTTLMQNAGLSWKGYEENTPGGCPITSSGTYASNHDPFVFFKDVSGNPPSSSNTNCASHVVDSNTLSSDVSGNTLPAYSFITPNLCDDMHDSCGPINDPILQGDQWLQNNLPTILNSTQYQSDGAVFITWDEGSSTNSPIGMIVLSPFAKGNGYTNNTLYSHSSLVRTVETIFGLSPLLANAASATDLSDLFVTSTQTPPDTTPPTVSITSPLNGAVVPRRTTVTIAASASDNVGVTKVNFYVNNTLKCTDTTAPSSCVWFVPSKRHANYALVAKAYDAANNVGTSNTVTVHT